MPGELGAAHRLPREPGKDTYVMSLTFVVHVLGWILGNSQESFAFILFKHGLAAALVIYQYIYYVHVCPGSVDIKICRDVFLHGSISGQWTEIVNCIP